MRTVKPYSLECIKHIFVKYVKKYIDHSKLFKLCILCLYVVFVFYIYHKYFQNVDDLTVNLPKMTYKTYFLYFIEENIYFYLQEKIIVFQQLLY